MADITRSRMFLRLLPGVFVCGLGHLLSGAPVRGVALATGAGAFIYLAFSVHPAPHAPHLPLMCGVTAALVWVYSLIDLWELLADYLVPEPVGEETPPDETEAFEADPDEPDSAPEKETKEEEEKTIPPSAIPQAIQPQPDKPAAPRPTVLENKPVSDPAKPQGPSPRTLLHTAAQAHIPELAEESLFDADQAYAQARTEHLRGNLDEAATLYHQIIDHSPTDANCLFQLGKIYLEKGDRTAAEVFFGSCRKVDTEKTWNQEIDALLKPRKAE